jgi:hypothetical protein
MLQALLAVGSNEYRPAGAATVGAGCFSHLFLDVAMPANKLSGSNVVAEVLGMRKAVAIPEYM